MFYGDEWLADELEASGFKPATFNINDICEACPLWKLVDRTTATSSGSSMGSSGVFVTLQDAAGRRAQIQYAPGYSAEDSEELSGVTELAAKGVESCGGPSKRRFRVISPRCRASHFGFTRV